MAPKADTKKGKRLSRALRFLLIVAQRPKLGLRFLPNPLEENEACGTPHASPLRESVDALLDPVHSNTEVLLPLLSVEVDVALKHKGLQYPL